MKEGGSDRRKERKMKEGEAIGEKNYNRRERKCYKKKRESNKREKKAIDESDQIERQSETVIEERE